MLAVGLLYPPHYLGGYELVCEGVMRAAHARGHEIQILTSDHRAPGVSEPDELPVDRTLRSYLDASAQHAAAITPLRRLALERANAVTLERHLREFTPDVVSWWGMGGMSISLIERVRRKRLPAVLVVQDPWLSYGFQADGWTRMTRRLLPLARLLEPLSGIPIRYELQTAGRFVFNSEHTRDVSEAAGVKPLDSAVNTPGVHARYLAPSPSNPWDWRLLQVGRIDPDKGIDISLAALAQLPERATLTIIGAGDPVYEARLRSQAQAAGVGARVRFLGPVAAETLPSHYARADAVLFPIRWEEPWGLVPLEAMGIGRPVLATPRGGARTYLRDEQNCLFLAPEDPRALAGALERLAGDPELRARLRCGGIATAAEHSAERHDQRLVDELEAYAERPRGSWARPGGSRSAR